MNVYVDDEGNFIAGSENTNFTVSGGIEVDSMPPSESHTWDFEASEWRDKEEE